MTATIQWYPGHMAKAMRRLAEDLRIVDVVIEAVDARVPGAGANSLVISLQPRDSITLTILAKTPGFLRIREASSHNVTSRT